MCVEDARWWLRCVGEACSCWLWIKGVRGTCKVVPSGLAQTRAGVVSKKIAVREFSSLVYSTPRSRCAVPSAAHRTGLTRVRRVCWAWRASLPTTRCLCRFQSLKRLRSTRIYAPANLTRTRPYFTIFNFVESGTNLSRLLEQLQLRYKPSKNVPRTTP